MKTLILKSNWRARVAIQLVRIMGRLPETMAELRDGLNERRAMRSRAKFSLWFNSNESQLRNRWALFCARHPFRCQSGTAESQWNDFVTGEYLKESAQ